MMMMMKKWKKTGAVSEFAEKYITEKGYVYVLT